MRNVALPNLLQLMTTNSENIWIEI